MGARIGPRLSAVLICAAVLWAVIVMAAVVVEAFVADRPVVHVEGPTPSRAETDVTFLGCIDGSVHAWLFPDGSGAVMPAGADCPEEGP